MVLKIDREFTSVPTLDKERKTPFVASGDWTPSNINIFGHSINIDISTGNLIISTTDVAYPYYKFSIGINRKYDLQEQHMQIQYQHNYPNINPKPHWFGNWQFAYEADLDEIWRTSLPELHITSETGINSLFEQNNSDFLIHQKSSIENILLTYGIPKRTLNELNWLQTPDDFLLRTKMDTFQITTGFFYPETLVDNIYAKIWIFSPISGSGFLINSDYFYNEPSNQYRDIGFPLVVTNFVDCLGHKITLQPVPGTTPPFKEYELFDDSTLPNPLERKFLIKLGEELTFPDGLKTNRLCRRLIVNEVFDKTKTAHNKFEYHYSTNKYGSCDFKLLENVLFPCSIAGNRRKIIYHYNDPQFPGVLSAIEDTEGSIITFEYFEDLTDNDDRLNPRLKIHKIIDPVGITYEYNYDHLNGKVSVKISQNAKIDQISQYTYIRDIENTKKRYIRFIETKVERGYREDGAGTIVERDVNNHQIVKYENIYTNDGRYNIAEKVDPLHGKRYGTIHPITYNRIRRFSYNDFNQVVQTWDFDGKYIKYIYDIPINPSPTNPIRYDLKKEEKQNIIRTLVNHDPLTFQEEHDKIISRSFEYKKYEAMTSTEPLDYELSTHRLIEVENERGKKWKYSYDDFFDDTGARVGDDPHKQFKPSLCISPLGNETKAVYNDRGNVCLILDAETNKTTFEYFPQGQVKSIEDPNDEIIELRYYPCGSWLNEYEDQLHKVTTFIRRSDGQITRIIDPIGDYVDYEYYSNLRLNKITEHRPALPGITAFPNLDTIFAYNTLGNLASLTNPRGLNLIIEYDELGRKTSWYTNHNPNKTRYLYNESGQLIQIVDRTNKAIKYEYHNLGFLHTIKAPDWMDNNNVPVQGKIVNFMRYDYSGRMLSQYDSEITGDIFYCYDESGNLTFRQSHRSIPSGLLSFQLKFTYDDDDRLEDVRDPRDIYILHLTLDSLGRVRELKDSGHWDIPIDWFYTYQKISGTKKVLNLYKIETSNPLNIISEFDYDQKNRLTSISHIWIPPTPPPPTVDIFPSQTLEYRDDNLLWKIHNFEPNLYSYDALKQLIHEEYLNNSIDYDRAGNRLYNIDKTTYPGFLTNNYNNLNHLKREENIGADLTYDGKGNLKSFISPTINNEYWYDGFNRLRIFKNNSCIIKYQYDFEGKLTKREVNNTETTIFNYLFTKPIVLYRDQYLTPFMILTWDSNGKLLRIHSENIGAGNYQHSIFPIYNGLGDIVQLLNSDNNKLVDIRYNAWGEMTLTDPAGKFEFWGYKGGIVDLLSKLIKFGERWYFPKLGRWISQDPSEDFSTSNCDNINNQFSYVFNNPINYHDLSGLQGSRRERGNLIVLITKSDYFGISFYDHTAIWIENEGNPILLDIDGSFNRNKQTGPIHMYNASLKDYLNYHRSSYKNGSIESYIFNINLHEQRKFIEYIIDARDSGLSCGCALSVSAALRSLNLFKDLGISITPGGLRDDLEEIEDQQRNPK